MWLVKKNRKTSIFVFSENMWWVAHMLIKIKIINKMTQIAKIKANCKNCCKIAIMFILLSKITRLCLLNFLNKHCKLWCCFIQCCTVFLDADIDYKGGNRQRHWIDHQIFYIHFSTIFCEMIAQYSYKYFTMSIFTWDLLNGQK